jgi:hypothetical protein
MRSLARAESAKAAQNIPNAVVAVGASIIIGAALLVVVNDQIIEHRILALLRREPRLWLGVIANRLGFSSSAGNEAIERVLARLERRHIISAETGCLLSNWMQECTDVDMWSLIR